MRLENYSVEQLKKEIRVVLKKYLELPQYKVFFFGSRAKGDNFPRADIDVGIEGTKPLPASIKLAIEEDLERLPLLYKFDFVDFKKVSPEFKKEALRYVESII